ncbi:UDP-N-acetylmuramoyl-L-alanine--D-glutamate ligase [Candidatus Saganbacteria bacterium CG08_land_8_20_14_0_20_45_16]|uniref:UDP-N-acetylmuramoylalanine--D-glutamate ligase n=1 Tax=Candidatus Saganbacteria bacterium CG08_land_8_20_14_0_20_45_16 TaxID=2014293 RepID=A0A2H0XTT0_UNCSA|nr:MAG: UDP-N-acetylmuramoyl-L-alanine--D-glutamate ligase [Candidatus Saganbacteria bacterium CG08_land_8_20_14_0_20_45_16]
MNNLADKNILIFGLARSGLAAAKKLALLGARVTITDIKKDSDVEPETIRHLKDLGVRCELGGHPESLLQGVDLIVVSPGIYLDLPILQKATAPIISEIELAFQILKKPIIAVTGTNGKTTTTTLIGELLRAGGNKVAVAGNIGNPLVEVDDTNLDYVVAEISSYQLETTKKFKPFISVVLNIQPDHLERHKTMAEYIKQKAKVFAQQTSDDYLVYNLDDPQVEKMVKAAKAKPVPFSKDKKGIVTLDPAGIKIPGRHNLENALAAASVAKLCNVDEKIIAKVLKAFPGVEHRIEFVRAINGVKFYNDSKATNPDSTLVAIETFIGKRIVLILGGKDKGVSLEQLVKAVKKNVAEVILIGQATKRFKQVLAAKGFKAILLAKTMPDAVKKSLELARQGDVVLLSPACASFDMFSNFEERGRLFKQTVLQYASTKN